MTENNGMSFVWEKFLTDFIVVRKQHPALWNIMSKVRSNKNGLLCHS
jgi:hypothetical protein